MMSFARDLLLTPEVVNWILNLRAAEVQFLGDNRPLERNRQENNKRLFPLNLRSVWITLRSICDYSSLLRVLNSLASHEDATSRKVALVYTTPNFSTSYNGTTRDRILPPFEAPRRIYINYSKQNIMCKVEGYEVYNIGGLAKLLSRSIPSRQPVPIEALSVYGAINGRILRLLRGNSVYVPCFYHSNGLSIVLSRWRCRCQVIEIQHGSIINYPPYALPAPVKCADTFLVRNAETADYLRSHLCKHYAANYRVIQHPVLRGDWRKKPGLNLFYASSVETNGFHKAFVDFLRTYKGNDLSLRVRLHPREQNKQSLFEEELRTLGYLACFDKEKDWWRGNDTENLVVVSPWSSVIEEACDIGLVAITIDPAGRKRFKHLIDHGKCYYSEDLRETLEKLRTSGQI